mgnify:FL=1
MTYLVTDNCVKCKHTDCVSVCPVDCFYEVDDMLVIHPDECIDCGVCQPECPVDAIVPDIDLEDGPLHKWMQINKRLSEEGDNITDQKDPLPDADKWEDVPNKYEMFIEKSIPIKEIE